MLKKNKRNFQFLTIPFSIISIAIVAVCYYLLQFVELIVHGDLYGYGLLFSYDWANQYWNYSGLMRNSILLSILIATVAMVFIIIQIISAKNFIKQLSSIFIVVKIFFIIYSLFSLIRLDFIINNSLYTYGLQFSYDWAGPYWNTLVLIFGLFITAIMIDSISILLLIGSESWFYKGFKSVFNINSLLFFFGVMMLYVSVNFNSSVLAFLGLGLIFWGAILLYIRPDRYVKEDLLLSAAKSSVISLRQLALELGYHGKGIYLPPKYLRDLNSSKAFINKTSTIVLPLVTQIQNRDTMIIENPEGLLVTPPGFDLSMLFEKTLGINFIQKDLSFVELNLRRLIIDDLEIAQNI